MKIVKFKNKRDLINEVKKFLFAKEMMNIAIFNINKSWYCMAIESEKSIEIIDQVAQDLYELDSCYIVLDSYDIENRNYKDINEKIDIERELKFMENLNNKVSIFKKYNLESR